MKRRDFVKLLTGVFASAPVFLANQKKQGNGSGGLDGFVAEKHNVFYWLGKRGAAGEDVRVNGKTK